MREGRQHVLGVGGILLLGRTGDLENGDTLLKA